MAAASAAANANGGMPSYLAPTLHTYYKAITLCLHLHPNQPRVSKSDFQICSTYPGRPPLGKVEALSAVSIKCALRKAAIVRSCWGLFSAGGMKNELQKKIIAC